MLKQGVLKIKNNFIDDNWTVTKSQEVAEMIVRDVKGDTIHVTIGPDEFKKRKDEVASLMKLETHLIKNFRVLKNDATYKYVDHAFKLNFISGTLVTPFIPDMPVSGFKFKKFEEIQAFEFREDMLYGKFTICITWLAYNLIVEYSDIISKQIISLCWLTT
ncbi:hypothetical protein QL285_072186 [Trifolium repens]|nr:hypothetical protein QL285_072186 [Trifolium repens]